MCVEKARWAIALFGGACLACTASYKPLTPHVGMAPGASVIVRRIFTTPPAAAGNDQVEIQAAFALLPGTALASARLAPMNAPPCTAGVEPMAWTDLRLGVPSPPLPPRFLSVAFSRASVDREGLLWAQPTALDIEVLHATAAADCLRVPLVTVQSPEWRDSPVYSYGFGFRLVTPFQRVYGVDAAPMFVVRDGRWFGPLRLRVELAGGGAFAHSDNANLIGYSYGGGLLADALVFTTKGFGLGIAAGYDITGISYGANIDSFSHAGAGFAGFIHGPRAGLTLAAIPERPPGPAFAARRGANSLSLEIFGAALWQQERAAALPALWMVLSMDAGWP